jgi:hypothetical protein
LAGGGGYPSETITPEEFAEHLSKSQLTKDVLRKSLKNVKLITTRDKMAQAFLEKNNIDSTLLPCSGTFAGHYVFGENYKTTRKINAICLTANFLKNRKDKDELIKEFRKTKIFLEKNYDKKCIVLAQVKKNDYDFLNKHFNDVVCVDSPLDILDYYKEIDICISTRLHCALPMYGIGAKSILIRVDSRGIAGEECGLNVINLTDYKHETVEKIIKNNQFSNIDPYYLKDKMIEFYKENLKKIL